MSPAPSSPRPGRDQQDDLATRIGRRTRETLDRAAPLCALHKVRIPDPLIQFDLRGQAAGQAQMARGRRPLLRFNLAIAAHHEHDFLARTVVHEVAHLVTFACFGRTAPHGREWREVMAFLGIDDAQRCHDYALDPTAVRRQERWDYRCGCSKHALSTTRHRRIERGTRYHCRRCQGILVRDETRRD